MPEPKPITARGVAAEVLTETRKDKQFAGDALDHYPKLANRQKATDLVFGVIKNRPGHRPCYRKSIRASNCAYTG